MQMEGKSLSCWRTISRTTTDKGDAVMKVRVGVFFGGRSVEHEVSIISALQAVKAFDVSKYDVVPVYVTRDNRF